MAFLALITSTHAIGQATAHLSPLSTPSASLVFQSPVLQPTLGPEWLSQGLRRSTYSGTLLQNGVSVIPAPIVNLSLSATLTLSTYLPVALNDYPPYLLYGERGLAGRDVYDLLGQDYNAYYGWTVGPNINDVRFARMVWCVNDYYLYTLGYANQITQAAQSDAGHVLGRVWLIFNEPENAWMSTTYTNTVNGEGWQCGDYPLEGNPPFPSFSNRRVADHPEEAAVRYSMIYDWIKNNDPTAKVFTGGLLWIHNTQGRNWWITFINTLASRNELYKLEGVHIHGYPGWSTGGGCASPYCIRELAQQFNTWYEAYHVGLGLGDLPIWITETDAASAGNLCTQAGSPPTPTWNSQAWMTATNQIMKPLSWWFAGDTQWPYTDVQTNPGYESVFWFIPGGSDPYIQQFWCSFLEDGHLQGIPPTLTPLGEYWRTYDLQPLGEEQ